MISFVMGTFKTSLYFGCNTYGLLILFIPIAPYENILPVFFYKTLNFVSQTSKVGTKFGFNVALQVGSYFGSQGSIIT
jgi:hypothetical protein